MSREAAAVASRDICLSPKEYPTVNSKNVLGNLIQIDTPYYSVGDFYSC